MRRRLVLLLLGTLLAGGAAAGVAEGLARGPSDCGLPIDDNHPRQVRLIDDAGQR